MPPSIQGRREAFFASALTKVEQRQLNVLLRKLMLAFEVDQPGRALAVGGRAQPGVAGARAQRVEALRLPLAFDAVRDVVAQCRSVLEAVARPAADQPPRLVLGDDGRR